MSKGTVYIMPGSARSNWLPVLIKHLGLDIKSVDFATAPNFTKEFPLHKVPAFIGSDGFKLTEIIAIVDYFISLVPDSKLFGSTEKERVQVLRWLSFLNQDAFSICINLLFSAKNEDDKKKFTEKLYEVLKYIDNELSTRKYIALKDKATVADVFGFGILNVALALSDNSEFPNIAKWKDNLIETQPIVQDLNKK